MKPYYYVFKPVGHQPTRKHATLEEAVKESQRLCEMHPNQTFEVLQCLAITSAPKPQVSTSYMDGVVPKTDERYIGFPDGMMLPKIREGFCHAVYRGVAWTTDRHCYYAIMDIGATDTFWFNQYGVPVGNDDKHYCEFLK